MKDRARSLRKRQTEVENKLWHALRGRRFFNYKFRRQRIIEGYIVDFVCLKPKVIIELDGSQHLDNQEYDKIRTKLLNAHGFIVLRFWNNQVLKEFYGVLNKILDVLSLPSSGAAHHLLPRTGEGKTP